MITIKEIKPNGPVKYILTLNKDLVRNNNFDDLYLAARNHMLPQDVGLLTRCLLNAGINPLTYVTNIHYAMYFNCMEETKGHFIIPDSADYLGPRCFEGCSLMSELDLPKTLNIIDKNAFSDCSSLHRINYLGTAEDWQEVFKYSWWDNGLPDGCNIVSIDGEVLWSK